MDECQGFYRSKTLPRDIHFFNHFIIITKRKFPNIFKIEINKQNTYKE